MPTNKRNKPLKPRWRWLNAEDLDKLGLPRETLAISPGFTRKTGKPVKPRTYKPQDPQ
jgi:hypothetical protein